MSVIERAQAAVVAELFRQGGLMDAGLGNIDVAQVDGSFQVEPIVRAVLRSIREPSEEMVVAIPLAERSFLSPVTAPRDLAIVGWRAMIDAALTEE